MKQDRGPIRKFSATQWARTNFGIVQSVHRTRKEAIEECERECGEPWTVCSRYMEVRKVLITEIEK